MEGQSQPTAEERQRRLVVRGVELVAVVQYLGSQRFREHVIVGAIGVAALVSLARENQARTLARVAAWDKRRRLLVKRPAKVRREVTG